MFVQRLAADGRPEWVVVGGEARQLSPSSSSDGEERRRSTASASTSPQSDAEPSTAVAAAIASSLYADMLHDRRRAALYAEALVAVVRPGDLVLDIGTGTGLLAILAARAAPDVTVIACDQFLPITHLATATVAAAGLTDAITIHACRSEEVVLPPLRDRADVVVSEILDSVLLGEGALPTALDVGRRLLAPSGVAIPARGRVFAQAVASLPLRSCWDGGDWGSLAADPAPRPLHLDALAAAGAMTPVGPPTLLLAVDLTRPDGVTGTEMVRLPLEKDARARGVDALAVWWEVDLSPDGRVQLSTAPAWVADGGGGRGDPSPPSVWTDHWRACWVPSGLPPGPVEADILTVRADYGPTDLSVRVVVVDVPPVVVVDVPPVVVVDVPPAPPPPDLAACYMPAGLGLWASAGRAAGLVEAAAAARSPDTTPTLTLGDGPLPALTALRAGTGGPVVAVVTSSPAAAAAVGAAASGADVATSLPVLPHPPATALLAEPHYRAMEARAPWEATASFLRDWAALVAGGALAASARVCPAGARVLVVGAALPDLARTTSAPLGAVAGVDMAPLDSLMVGERQHGRWLVRSVGWQCGTYAEATGRTALGGDLAAAWGGGGGGSAWGEEPLPPTLVGQAVLRPSSITPTTVDALVFWVEYAATPGGRFDTWPAAPAGSAGGPTPGVQAVWLLPTPLAVPPDGFNVRLTLKVMVDARLGGPVDVRAVCDV